MYWILRIILVGLFIQNGLTTTECQEYVGQLIYDIINLNITQIPLPSLMYSGISVNNPGQQLQCLDSNYSYFLVYIKNTTVMVNTFTGICIPPQCKLQDVETALQFLDCQVYQLDNNSSVDSWGYIGIFLLIGWVTAVTIWSIITSCRQPDDNQFLVKDQASNKSLREPTSLLTNEHSEQNSPSIIQAKQQWKLFNYYEGYRKIFKVPSNRNIMSPIYFLAVLSLTISTQFSYRQLISQNQPKGAQMLKKCWWIICFVIMFVLGLKLAYGTYKIKTFKQMGRYFFDEVLKKWILLFLLTFFIYGLLSFIDQPLQKIWRINNGKDCPTTLWQYWFLFRNFQLNCSVCLPWLWLLEAEIILTIMASPLIVFFRVSKKLTYPLLVVFVGVCALTGYVILDSSKVFYQPQRLFNNQLQFIINYGTNSLVRGSGFFLGLIFGLVILEGLQKLENQKRKPEYNLAKKVRRNDTLQTMLQIIGVLGMGFCYSLLGLFLFPGDRKDSDSKFLCNMYIIIVPICFVLFLIVFIIPSFWQGKSKVSRTINKILGWSPWVHLDRIALMFYILTPIVIAFTTFNMQSSIYYDADTLITYLLGDLLIIYVLSLLATAAIQNQIYMLSNWLEFKIFGSENKYSILVIEQ